MRYAVRQSADPNHQLLAKNFPGDITIDQIRGYFQQFGTLEDVQITFGHNGPGESSLRLWFFGSLVLWYSFFVLDEANRLLCVTLVVCTYGRHCSNYIYKQRSGATGCGSVQASAGTEQAAGRWQRRRLGVS